MAKMLWQPSKEWKDNANITKLINKINEKYDKHISSYDELYNWSIENIPEFWAEVWDFVDIKASKTYDQVVDDENKMPGAKWFSGAKLNFAENLLRFRDDHTALVFQGENQTRSSITYKELYDQVARLSKSLREIGVEPGDRVVGYMPNMMETIICMLAAASIGASWSSCATDMGLQAAGDRLGQVEPKVMITCDGYYYKNKYIDSLSNAAGLEERIPSLEKIIVTSYHGGHRPDISGVPKAIHYQDFLADEDNLEIEFEQLPFDHPLYIMFSSGTTGKPKCMVQSAGGVLINHMLEHIIHTDLKRNDVFFYITTCSWMMWNWMVSSLAVGNTLVLYDGNPNYPDGGAMWKFIEDEGITVFGCSASYINYLRSADIVPKENYDLSTLREISQTGSPLSAEGFEYVYENVKEDLWLNSISGGTDINGCFCIGSPIQPVYAGQLQGAGLGKKMKVYDDDGSPVLDQVGELVCEAAIPSMPLYFWDDPNGEKYHEAYFDVFPGIWRHGDYVICYSDTGGFTFYGRSDSVLKPSGVRIGTAEIYNTVEKLDEIVDALAIGQSWKDDQRVILFVKLKEGYSLDENLDKKIKKTLMAEASPRHVPAKIIEAPDIPYTMNNKKVENAVTNIIHGKEVKNKEALANPDCLDFYESIVEDLNKE